MCWKIKHCYTAACEWERHSQWEKWDHLPLCRWLSQERGWCWAETAKESSRVNCPAMSLLHQAKPHYRPTTLQLALVPSNLLLFLDHHSDSFHLQLTTSLTTRALLSLLNDTLLGLSLGVTLWPGICTWLRNAREPHARTVALHRRIILNNDLVSHVLKIQMSTQESHLKNSVFTVL